MAEEGDEGSNSALPSKDKLLMTCAIIVLGILGLFMIIAAFALIGYLTGNQFGGGGGPLSGCTSSQLSQSMLDQIQANKSVYQAAADRADVPWDFLVAIHYRETSLSTTDSNPFQIQNNKNTGFSVDSATEAGNKAKALVSGTYGKDLTKSADEETLKLAFLSYNRGAMYKEHGCTWDQSPYVMNNFDASHKDMKWPDNECEPPATRGKTDGKLGGFTVLSILRGCAAGGTTGGEGACTWSNIQNDPKGANIGSVEVPIWKYEGPSQKTPSKMTLRVNNKCATSIKAIFTDIYNSADKPPIDPANTSCYQQRDSDSRHNWGVACDISFKQNWCWNCYAKKTSSDICTVGSPIGDYWKPGNIEPDRTYKGWSAGLDNRSAPINGTIANAFKNHGWGRGIYKCFNDFMHFSVDGH